MDCELWQEFLHDAEGPRPEQAIYPVLIIVIVALNWSPIDSALTRTDATSVGGEDACSPASLYFDRTAMNTIVVVDTLHVRCVRDGEGDGASEAEVKRWHGPVFD